MAKQLSKITIRLLSVSIVLTVIGIDHNVSDIEAALAVRTIMAEQYAYPGSDKGTFYAGNLLFNYAIGTDSEGNHIVMTSRVDGNAQMGVEHHGGSALYVAFGFSSLPPTSPGLEFYNTSTAIPTAFSGHNVLLRAGPIGA